MDETATLIAVGAFVVLVCAARLIQGMLGGGRGPAGAGWGNLPRVRRVGRRPGGSASGARMRGNPPAGIGSVGRLADDEVRRVLDDLKAKRPPERR